MSKEPESKEPSLEDLVKMLIAEDRRARDAEKSAVRASYSEAERKDQIKQFKKNIKGAKVYSCE